MNQPFEQAKQLYSQHGDNFQEAIEWMQRNGAVVSTPNTFLMGFFCNQDNIQEPIAYEDADCVHVVLCVGDPTAALEQLVEIIDNVAYTREFRGDTKVRVMPIEQLYYKL